MEGVMVKWIRYNEIQIQNFVTNLETYNLPSINLPLK